MILADTSIWIDHLRRADDRMTSALDRAEVLMHPFVLGELVVGNLPKRAATLLTLGDLPRAKVASHFEVLAFVELERLFGKGVGYTDVHLIASARLMKAALWTRDRRPGAAAAAHATVLDA